MAAAMSPNTHRPVPSCSPNSSHSPKAPSYSNTHHIPPSSAPTSSQHSYFPPQPLISLSISRRPGSSAQSSHPISRSPSLTAVSHIPQNLPSPQFHNNNHHNHRDKHTTATGATRPQKLNQFIMLQERPESFTLTSSLAPPSVIPMTAAGIPSAKTTSRKSPATLKLSMLPSAMAPIIPTSNSGNAAPVYTFSNHHQAYALSLSAQQQLQLHQKEIIHQATRATGIPQHLLSTGPMSPRLLPLGSPGPVTPLTLEDSPDGFFAGSHGFGHQQLNQQLSIVASGQRGGL